MFSGSASDPASGGARCGAPLPPQTPPGPGPGSRELPRAVPPPPAAVSQRPARRGDARPGPARRGPREEARSRRRLPPRALPEMPLLINGERIDLARPTGDMIRAYPHLEVRRRRREGARRWGPPRPARRAPSGGAAGATGRKPAASAGRNGWRSGAAPR